MATNRGRKSSNGSPGRPLKKSKKAQTQGATDAGTIQVLKTQLEVQQADIEAERAALEKKEKQLKAKIAALAKTGAQAERAADAGQSALDAAQIALGGREAKCSSNELADSEAPPPAKVSPLCLDFINESVEKLRPKTGELLTKAQSRIILMLYFDLVKTGSAENRAVLQVARALKIGKDKVYSIRAHWSDHGELLETSAKGRGACVSDEDKRLSTITQEDLQR